MESKPAVKKLEPCSDKLLGIQSQNLYLINYVNKLEFMLI